MLVHKERFEILVIELVQLGDHVAVAEIRVLIYSHNEQPGKCVDDQITHFKVLRRLATKPVGVGALDFHQGFVI